MTEARPPKKARWSRGQIRLLAWVSGSTAFVAVAGLVGLAPKAADARDTGATRKKPPVQKVIVRRIIRRIVIVDAPTPTYSSGSSGGSTTYSSSSGGVTVAAPAPAPAPVSTGGSAPP